MHDFVTQPKTNIFLCPFAAHLTFTHLSSTYRQALQAYLVVCELISFKEVIVDPAWVKAMKLEIATLDANKTWSKVDHPFGKKPIRCQWIYKIKFYNLKYGRNIQGQACC